MWSPDLEPPAEGLPADKMDFDVLVQMSTGEAGKVGGEVFDCRVCSVSALNKSEPGEFTSSTLVLEKFDWADIKTRINKLILHASSCAHWKWVIKQLYPCIQYSDEW